MSVLAIVPARGGSKGIPRKNLAMCAGRPLLGWTLDAAIHAMFVDRVVLSTDDPEIRNYGYAKHIHVHDRSPEMATDEAQLEPVIESVLQDNPGFDVIVLLQPTSPLRAAENVDEAVAMLVGAKLDSVMSVVASHSLLWFVDEDGNSQPMYAQDQRPNRQDMEERVYEENGAIYAFTKALWDRDHVRTGGKTGLLIMSEAHRIQVDSPFDLRMAEHALLTESVALRS